MFGVSSEGERNERSAVVLSIMAALLFGSQYVVIKLGMKDIDPLFFGAMTTAIGGLVALTYMQWVGRFPLRTFLHWEVWAAAVSTAGLIAFQYIGLTMTTASVGGLIIGSNIIFVAPISAVVFKERLGWRRTMGVVIGLLGVFTISTGWDLSSLTSGEILGNVLLTGASLCIALSYPINRLATRKMGFEEWVTGFHLLAPLFLLPLAVMDGEIGTASWEAAPAVLFVGALCTSVPTLLWAKGLQSLTFVTSATILLSESVFAVILGLVILGEPMTALTIAGALMVFAAIFLASYKR
ncbi:MAG TPA: DMT family transporter [Methanomassiliicoccaceae archaeon]|nr:DMT family transporter [Euryarchaeota archaeon]HOB37947.1 DMT family transporter [Methanomassiliicoccaceae archaeon]HPT73756.1 DMT family transporter [Methanomassiliicoccaceae archaeon]HQA21123.1 DMT family transporter [Methanomassiliicoccaceae archaeon]HQD87659.1 DMT family transporter [Methanomassiliicoccaceae archaeon]